MCLPTYPEGIERRKNMMRYLLIRFRDYNPSEELVTAAKDHWENNDHSLRHFYRENRDHLFINGWGTTEAAQLTAFIEGKGTLQITDEQIERVVNRLDEVCRTGVKRYKEDTGNNICMSYLFLTARLCELENVKWIYLDQWKEGNQKMWDKLCQYLNWGIIHG